MPLEDKLDEWPATCSAVAERHARHAEARAMRNAERVDLNGRLLMRLLVCHSPLCVTVAHSMPCCENQSREAQSERERENAKRRARAPHQTPRTVCSRARVRVWTPRSNTRTQECVGQCGIQTGAHQHTCRLGERGGAVRVLARANQGDGHARARRAQSEGLSGTRTRVWWSQRRCCPKTRAALVWTCPKTGRGPTCKHLRAGAYAFERIYTRDGPSEPPTWLQGRQVAARGAQGSGELANQSLLRNQDRVDRGDFYQAAYMDKRWL